MDPSPLFDYMRARHEIYLRRKAGLPRSEWTDDPIFQQYRFCNVFRELDTTTIWLRENVREKVPVEHVMLATVLFRWFNRMVTGNAIFNQLTIWLREDGRHGSAWDSFVATGDVAILKAAILQFCGKGPYVTGSYIIKTPDGMDKLDGVLWCVEQFHRGAAHFYTPNSMNWEQMTKYLLENNGEDGLQHVWEWLRQFKFMGDFSSYEVVTDLRHTPLLNKAPDIMTWANPGPGAMRGLNRLAGRDLKFRQPKEKFIEEMRILLSVSDDPEMWPRGWPALEMRDIEHSACEYDKIVRIRNGEGKTKQRFK